MSKDEAVTESERQPCEGQEYPAVPPEVEVEPELTSRRLNGSPIAILKRGVIILGIICGVSCGAVSFMESLGVFAVRNAPVVTGRVVSRKAITQYSVPRVDFMIRIEGSSAKVHAHAQRYLMTKVPDIVHFRYSGDPTREVFLFEYEEHPYFIALTCWGIASMLILLVVASRWSARVRKILAWGEP